MKTLRALHLYLGSLFAPALLVLAVSGAWQVFRWNDAKKDGSYTPAPLIQALSAVHKDQVLPPARHGQGVAMEWFTFAASLGLTLTTCLGIVMAYKVTRRPGVVTALLLAGIVTPAVLLTSCVKPAAPRAEAPKKAPAPAEAVPAASSKAASGAWTPGLGELMSLQQMRHVKLWLAGDAGNWRLAAYEVDELKEGFEDIVKLHPTQKGSPVGIDEIVPRLITEPLEEVGRAVAAADRARFGKAFDAVTAACNSCHQATNFGFNVVRRPATNPYPNQIFAPPRS